MELIREINDKLTIKCKEDNLNYLEEFKNEDREFFIVLGLDTKNRVLYREVVAIGTLNSCLAHPREIFKTAIKNSVNSIIIAHNHPSGDCEPSQEDIDIYNKIIEGGKILGIEVLDSLIITSTNLKSLKEDLE